MDATSFTSLDDESARRLAEQLKAYQTPADVSMGSNVFSQSNPFGNVPTNQGGQGARGGMSMPPGGMNMLQKMLGGGAAQSGQGGMWGGEIAGAGETSAGGLSGVAGGEAAGGAMAGAGTIAFPLLIAGLLGAFDQGDQNAVKEIPGQEWWRKAQAAGYDVNDPNSLDKWNQLQAGPQDRNIRD